ncbi:MAG: hypothetical protein MZV70_46140 [Desulfobacterales bacterium]|nr:hypothetical protein [Desulfobacterales bacterium]
MANTTPANVRLLSITARLSALPPSSGGQAAGKTEPPKKVLILDGVIFGDRATLEADLAAYLMTLKNSAAVQTADHQQEVAGNDGQPAGHPVHRPNGRGVDHEDRQTRLHSSRPEPDPAGPVRRRHSGIPAVAHPAGPTAFRRTRPGHRRPAIPHRRAEDPFPGLQEPFRQDQDCGASDAARSGPVQVLESCVPVTRLTLAIRN